MKKTKLMKEREQAVGSEWKDEGDGYFSMTGSGFSGDVAYIALPKGHPDIEKGYDDLNPEVNGGLTFGDENIFGWDYGHCSNYGTPEEHIKNALDYFRAREKRK